MCRLAKWGLVELTVAMLAWQSRTAPANEPAASGVQPAPAAANQAAPSPAQSLLRLSHSSRRFGTLDLVNTDVSGTSPEKVNGTGVKVFEPSWSPGGKQVVLTSFASGMGQVYIMNADGTGARNLTNTTTFERTPSWSPDGTKIVFTSTRDGNPEIFVMNPDGSGATNVTNHDSYDADPSWSPDGSQIALASNRSGAFRLWIINADGSGPRDLLNKDQGGALYPTWSPDGKQIVFGGRADDGSVKLFVTNADGKGAQQFTQGPGFDSFPAWSHDARYIAYMHFPAFPQGANPPQPLDEGAAGGDLMMYDLLTNVHTKISTGDIPPMAPRPSWKR